MSDKANNVEKNGSSTDEGKKRSAPEPATVDLKRAKPVETLDLGVSLGIKAGDRLEVQWEIGEPEDGSAETRWWGATLLEHDGKTDDDGVAIRVLQYDEWAEGGFPEKSKEEIIFIGRDVLVDVKTQEQLGFRLLSDDNSAVLFLGIDEVENVVNTLLEGALSNVSDGFNRLPRAQQAFVAEQVASKKAKLIELLKKHMEEMGNEENGNRVVTADDARRLLAQAMMEE